MTLADLGYTYGNEVNTTEGFSIGRVMREHRERYTVSTGDNEYDCEITGNLRFSASSRTDFPAVGDFVGIQIYDPGMAIIHKVLPRKSALERKATGKNEIQIISANIDTALIMQSVGNNFNINRLERYLTICYAAAIEPVLVISKTDLSSGEEMAKILATHGIKENKIKTILLSNITLTGLDQILALLQKAKTYCVIGSSGVGKSTLINNLLNKNALRTTEISESTNKGKHTTSHRELFILENGAIIIDTPGMRALGVTDAMNGTETTFEEIINLSLKCRFSDCSHTSEAGCAILEALENGTIDSASFDNFRKIRLEQERLHESIAEKHKKDIRTGRLYKTIMKEKTKNKYGTKR